MYHLRTLDVGSNIKGVSFKHLAEIKNLSTLKVGVVKLNKGDLEPLHKLKKLKSLDLLSCFFRDEENGGSDPFYLKELYHLEKLKLPSCKISPEGLSFLKNLYNLNELYAYSLEGLVDASLKDMRDLHHLQTLHIESVSSVMTDKSLLSLYNLFNLDLLFVGSQTTDEARDKIQKRFPHLMLI